MLDFSRKHLLSIAWGLAALSVAVSLIIWGDTLSWDAGNITNYSLFPLLGLIAFSLMWSQYAAGSIRRLSGLDKPVLARFSNITGPLVTMAILLHPALLIWQLWRDGSGLPPNSYLNYVNPSLKWAVLLGVIGLLILLSFELRHRYRDRTWWRYVDYANDAAVVAIYIHGFNLGSHTHLSWFFPLWLFYGASLSAFLLHKHFSTSRRAGWIATSLLVLAFAGATIAAKASNTTPAETGASTSSSSQTTNSADTATTPSASSHANGSITQNPGNSTAPTTTPVSPVADPSVNTITIKADGFMPADLTVKKGSPVIWHNTDDSEHAIDPAPGSSGPHSPPLKNGETYTYSFQDRGTYKYIDVMDPQRGGTITVTD